jgi:Fic family protein
MDYKKLLCLRDEYSAKKEAFPDAFDSFEKSFNISYAHESTAIEGNTLSLIETKAVIEDGLSVGGKTLRELNEVKNHSKAYSYVKKCIEDGAPFSEAFAKDIHAILMEGILVGGVYRNVAVRITGAGHKPPAPSEMYAQIKAFFGDFTEKTAAMNGVETAAYTHAEFVKIHPFVDGNGRASRLLMNYGLLRNKFAPVSIKKENRIAYFEALESYAVKGDLSPFSEMIAELEEAAMTEFIEAF